MPLLKEMVTRWRKASSEEVPALKTQCLELAAAILANWPSTLYNHGYRQEEKRSELLPALAALDDPKLIGAYLSGVLVKDADEDPGKALVTACKKHGWQTFQDQLLAVFENTAPATIERNVKLLEQIALANPGDKEPWLELCRALANKTVSALEKLEQENPPNDWRMRSVKRSDVLMGIARSLLATDQSELLQRFVAWTLTLPDKYSLSEVHLPALSKLQPWIEEHVQKTSPGLSQWIVACRKQLESLTAQVPKKPADFRRAALIACKCADCAELKDFLENSREEVHRFAVRQDRRDHLGNEIRQYRSDLTLDTERRRSPHVLVCTKNTASYDLSLKEYHLNQERLATLRAMETTLRKR